MKTVYLRNNPSFVVEIGDDFFQIKDHSKRNQFETFKFSEIDNIYFKKEEINYSSSILTMGISFLLPSGLGFGKIIKEVPRICMNFQGKYKEIFLDNCNLDRVTESLTIIKSGLRRKN